MVAPAHRSGAPGLHVHGCKVCLEAVAGWYGFRHSTAPVKIGYLDQFMSTTSASTSIGSCQHIGKVRQCTGDGNVESRSYKGLKMPD